MTEINQNRNNSKKVYLESEIARLDSEVESILLTYSKFSDYIYEELNENKEMKTILEKANTASVEEKEVLRKELYNMMYLKYESMQKHEYRQFHFHLPSTESFLRLHTPEKYGDLLYEIRESVRLTNKNLKKTMTFEEGRIFNGFRYVYPLKNNNKHIGSVELSVSSKSIIKILSELHENEDFYFLVDKDIVEEKVFKEEQKNYEELNFLEDFYLDRETKEVSDEYQTVIRGLENQLFTDIRAKHEKEIKAKESFATIYRVNDIDYTVSFLSIKNIKNRPVAYLVSIREIKGATPFTKSSYGEIFLVTLLAILIIILGFLLAYYNYRLKKTAGIDHLTQVYNRNKFYELVEIEERLSKRYGYESAIMLLDIDHFKKVNDNYGHSWGDKVLKTMASEILKNIREVDIFARWGGEEFVILLPHADKSGALAAAEKTRKLVYESELKELEDISISIGVTTIDPENYDIDKAIKRADKAMYNAKENGRNRVCFKGRT